MPFFHLDDENFRLAVSEQLNGRVNYDVDRLSSLKLNPLLPELHTNLNLCKDIDPDSNMFSALGNCEYYMLKNNLMISYKNKKLITTALHLCL